MSAPSSQEISPKKIGREINEIFDRFLRSAIRSFKDGVLTCDFGVSAPRSYPERMTGRGVGSFFIDKFCRVSVDESSALRDDMLVGSFIIRQSFKNMSDGSTVCIGEEALFFKDGRTNIISQLMKSRSLSFCELEKYRDGEAESRVTGFHKFLLSINKAAGFSDFTPSSSLNPADLLSFSGRCAGRV